MQSSYAAGFWVFGCFRGENSVQQLAEKMQTEVGRIIAR